MVAATMSAPPAGEFPISFGSSFFDLQSEPTHWSLRYDFKPASVSSAASGKIRMGTDNQVCLDLLNKQSGQGDLMFSGHSERYDGLDCVAVFDGRVWRLEMLAGSVKVRHVKSQGRSASGRLPTPPPAAALDQPVTLQTAAQMHQVPARPMETIHTQAVENSCQARGMSQEPSNQQQSTVDAVAVSPSTSSDTSTNGDDGSEEEDGQPALQPQSNSMSPSPRAVIPSPAHRQEQVANGHHAVQENGQAMPPNMTDLERQFFATQSPSSESSESSDSDESDEGSEDNENDGFEHF